MEFYLLLTHFLLSNKLESHLESIYLLSQYTAVALEAFEIWVGKP